MAPWMLHFVLVEMCPWWIALFLLYCLIEDVSTYWCRTCHSCAYFGSAPNYLASCGQEVAYPYCGWRYMFGHNYSETLTPPVYVSIAVAGCVSPVFFGVVFLLCAGLAPRAAMKRGACLRWYRPLVNHLK